MNTRNLEEFRKFAVDLARKVGEIQMKHYGRTHQLDWTAINNLRTETDKEISVFVRREIEREFPEHNIQAEESLAKITGHELTWVVDELDGTNPFAWGFNDHFSFCIALCEGKIPILGIVFAPKRNEFYLGEIGRGAFCNNEPIKVNNLIDLRKTWIGIDSGKKNRKSAIPYIEKAEDDDKGLAGPLKHGCASVPLCLVAKGNLHAYLGTALEPEDMAAAVCIIREAGGKVTNLQCKEWHLGDASILAANPELHEKLCKFFGII